MIVSNRIEFFLVESPIPMPTSFNGSGLQDTEDRLEIGPPVTKKIFEIGLVHSKRPTQHVSRVSLCPLDLIFIQRDYPSMCPQYLFVH